MLTNVDWNDDTSNAVRAANYEVLRPLLAERLRERPRHEWIARLTEAEVPCGAVRTIEEALNDPQLLAREMIASLVHPSAGPIRVLGTPIKLSATPGAIRTPPPRLGEHTRAVLGELAGLDDDAVDRLQEQGAI